MKRLSDEEREYVLFCLSLEETEFKMMLASMDDIDASQLLNLIQLAKDELFDDYMDSKGTPEADDLITYIKNTLE